MSPLILKYILSLKPYDRICWRVRNKKIVLGEFVRLPYTNKEPRSITARADGREQTIRIEAILRTCSNCGCTDTTACQPPCSWTGIKTCSACDLPKVARTS